MGSRYFKNTHRNRVFCMGGPAILFSGGTGYDPVAWVTQQPAGCEQNIGGRSDRCHGRCQAQVDVALAIALCHPSIRIMHSCPHMCVRLIIRGDCDRTIYALRCFPEQTHRNDEVVYLR